jgi:UDP-N-acetylglucosamine diphosphorylase/glucosamine-1-phosphate N-acetyltransferase
VNVVVFEDSGYKNLLPLVHLRPVWELRCGLDTGLEKIRRVFSGLFPGSRTILYCRSWLRDVAAGRSGLEAPDTLDGLAGETLFVNGRALVDRPVRAAGPVEVGVGAGGGEERVVYALLDARRAAQVTPELCLSDDFPARLREIAGGVSAVKHLSTDAGREGVQAGPVPDAPEDSFLMLNRPWDLVSLLECQINADIQARNNAGLLLGDLRGDTRGSTLLESGAVHMAERSRIMPGCVVNAETGPVFIDRGVTVYPGSYLQGPLGLGAGSLVKPGSFVSGSAVGPVCKIGGEVQGCVFQGYSNKQHHGFLGDSWVGSWCNFGAGTTGSDLKNTYANVKSAAGDRVEDTGLVFLGQLIGDHVKTAINTSLNTGTVIGPVANLFGPGLHSGVVPPFSWGVPGGYETYRLDRALQTIEVMMERREMELGPAERQLIEHLFRVTRQSRR